MKISAIFKSLAALSAFFIAGSASAQNAGTVTNHAFAIGKGAGTTGFTSMLCASAQLAVGQAAADPICQTITGDVTISAGGVTAIGAIGGKTVSLGGAFSTVGAFSFTGTLTGATSVTFPTTGTLLSSTTAAGGGLTGTYPNPTVASVPASALPNPSASTLGGVQSLAAVASKWINTISTSGVPSATQPTFTDISGQATLAQLPTLGANTVLGSIAGGTPIALTTAQHTSLVNTFTATLNGSVPNPGTVASKFLRDDGTWQAIAGAGTVTQVVCGTGLDGGTITASGTCSLSAARRTGRTITKFLTASSSGTYTTPANVLSLDLVLVAAGGGGEGSGTSHGNGQPGGSTCWNTSGAACTSPVYLAGGGAGGNATSGGAGGTISGSGTCDQAFAGGSGSPSNGSIATSQGSNGGANPLGGSGAGGPPGAGGGAGVANTGGGGGGAAANGTAGPGAGGGAGAYCSVHISAPAATYTYATGAAGVGGGPGTGGTSGGAGAIPGIWVRENYNIN